ncbi:hypothetical protein JTE90_012239 [Oedothorax gibbosus]|uniref:Galactosylceramide sulfotransferase n=1 Tax=Oedothorax gibbosus TaxID=931172 RepID=A0AAV6UYG8_9ARAC|nr:hypothetical protein JTE90_012239 [Oedothorax gibbosus]
MEKGRRLPRNHVASNKGITEKRSVVPNQKSFSFVSAVFCAAFIVYIIQYEQPDIHSVRRILSDEAADLFSSSDEEPFPTSPTNSCSPRRNIVFLKTHKCASSSVQNIFNRYGYRRKLNFVLPPRGGSYIGHPEPFNWSMVPDATKFGIRYNILTHHCRLNYDEMRRKMSADVVFVTIVRSPVELFESLFSFYSLQMFYRERFDTLGKHAKPAGAYAARMGGKIGFNQMLFDLGMDEKGFENASLVHDYVLFLDSVFDLVMVRERMDESLVLLKDLLCWDTDDVVVFQLNARNKRYKRKLSPDLLQRLEKFNSADILLYRHFVRRLNARIAEFGHERMAEAVEELRNRTRMWYDVCVQKQDFQSKIINSKRYFTNKMVMAYVKKNQLNATCDDLTTSEPIFTEKLVDRQRYMFPKPKPYRSRYRYKMKRWH